MIFGSKETIKLVLKEYNITFKEEKTSKYIVFTGKTDKKRRELLASMVYTLRQLGISAQHLANSSKSHSSGHIETDDGVFIVLKPIKGATENLKINGSKLTEGGQTEYLLNALNPSDRIRCRSFTSADQIKNSIITHLSNNPDVSVPIVNTFINYFNSPNMDTIEWNPLVTQSEKNELAKYMGEPLLGYLAFRYTHWSSITGKNFLNFPIKNFKIPISANNTGIDSIFVDSKDYVHFISNKVTRGARASFFTNILPILKNVNRSNLNSVLSNFMDVVDSTNGGERSAKEIVYKFGLNYILGLNLANPYKVYEEIYSKVLSKETLKVITEIEGYLNRNSRPYKEVVLRNLTPEKGYSSVTVFLCQEIARLFNEIATNKLLVNLISGNEVNQAVLNTNLWNSGTIRYSIESSGQLSLRIVGDKSTYGDIKAGHGLINYSLGMI
jgi:hypothetical protein